MTIRASDLTRINTLVKADPSPTLSGTLNTNNYPISNGSNPVTVGGNTYPATSGPVGYSLVSDGNGNLIFSLVSGGSSPQLYSEKVSGAAMPVANGNNSIALGNGASTNSINSLAIGLYSLSRLPGSVMQASGRFASTGDAQTGRYTLRTTTINDLPSELFLDGTGGSSHLSLVDNSTWTYRITICGHRTDVNDGHAGYVFTGVVYRNSGASTISFQGSPSKMILSESNSNWDAMLVADTATGSIRILVTGENSKTIRWVALAETVEITN